MNHSTSLFPPAGQHSQERIGIKHRLDRGEISVRAAIIELVNSLPCLADMHITQESWNPEHLAGLGAVVSSGERSALQFVLSVWNHHQKYAIGPFDIGSLDSWDYTHRQVLAEWVMEPWWC